MRRVFAILLTIAAIICFYFMSFHSGYDSAYDEAYENAFDDAKNTFYDEGYKDGKDLGYDNGYDDGYSEGFDEGYNEGYSVGLKTGKSSISYSQNSQSTYSSNAFLSVSPISRTVYVTDTGNEYHRFSCSYLKKSKHAISIATAKSLGYSPCSVCKP